LSYIPLNIHSEYSLLRSTAKCEDITKRLKALGIGGCGVTDYNSVSAAVDFSSEMKEESLKSILGCELTVDGYQELILCKNLEGWRELVTLVSLLYKQDINKQRLKKAMSSNDLISISGQYSSTLYNAVLNDNWKTNGVAVANMLRGIAGKNNFWIGIQSIAPIAMEAVSKRLRVIASLTDIPCVALPNPHYCESEYAKDLYVLNCIEFKTTIPEIERRVQKGTETEQVLVDFFSSDQFHIPSYEEMAELHKEEELEETIKIAGLCEDYDITAPPNPPEFKCPNGYSPATYLRKLCRDGWKKKMGHIDKNHPQFKEYGDRVNHELDVFTSIGLSSYFLIIDDILQYVRSLGNLTGVGRGSSMGSMVSYLLNITQGEPISYGLILERFYNAGRNTPGNISWPDIDFDIPKFSRAQAVDYIVEKYGKDNVASIVTFQTLKGKAALTRVMSAHGEIDFAEQKTITKCLLDQSKVEDELQDIEDEYGFHSTILWALEHKKKELKEWCIIGEEGKLSGPLASVFEQAIRLEHTKILSGKHAAGVVISNNPISDSCPMGLDKEGKNVLALFEGPSCERVGLLKLDALGLRTLDKVMEIVDILGGELC